MAACLHALRPHDRDTGLQKVRGGERGLGHWHRLGNRTDISIVGFRYPSQSAFRAKACDRGAPLWQTFRAVPRLDKMEGYYAKDFFRNRCRRFACHAFERRRLQRIISVRRYALSAGLWRRSARRFRLPAVELAAVPVGGSLSYLRLPEGLYVSAISAPSAAHARLADTADRFA